ncbi:putative splicing factor 3a subunit 1 [Nicotiana attenuata]|uniref:Splicing factor 3a subunit 1 n=1 Tax=Nicotiana attenuata TaxID=49451 RepID=A0A314KUE9_NICAT|nr:putative splicing factor 3a subunit 1 [Nicotiana attenuata]
MLGTMQNEEDGSKVPTFVATHTRTIGIIYPPPEIRNIVNTTAQYVAKNRPEFQKTVILNCAGNPKFKFLNASDPYHAYCRRGIFCPPKMLPAVRQSSPHLASALPDFLSLSRFNT